MTNPTCKTCNDTKKIYIKTLVKHGDTINSNLVYGFEAKLTDCPDCTKPKCSVCNDTKRCLSYKDPHDRYCDIKTWSDCTECVIKPMIFSNSHLSKAQQCKAKIDAVLQEFGGKLTFDDPSELILSVGKESISLKSNGYGVYNGKTEATQ